MERVRIATKCPACGSSTLVIGSGDWLVCSLIGCPDPTLINHFERAQPPTQTWTSEKPTKAGYYWWQDPTHYAGIKIVYVSENGHTLDRCGILDKANVQDIGGQWCAIERPLDSPPQE